MKPDLKGCSLHAGPEVREIHQLGNQIVMGKGQVYRSGTGLVHEEVSYGEWPFKYCFQFRNLETGTELFVLTGGKRTTILTKGVSNPIWVRDSLYNLATALRSMVPKQNRTRSYL